MPHTGSVHFPQRSSTCVPRGNSGPAHGRVPGFCGSALTLDVEGRAGESGSGLHFPGETALRDSVGGYACEPGWAACRPHAVWFLFRKPSVLLLLRVHAQMVLRTCTSSLRTPYPPPRGARHPPHSVKFLFSRIESAKSKPDSPQKVGHNQPKGRVRRREGE